MKTDVLSARLTQYYYSMQSKVFLQERYRPAGQRPKKITENNN